MGKQRGALFGFLTVAVLLAGSFPAHADTAGRPDDPTADETYHDVQGPSYAEEKSGGLSFQLSLTLSNLVAEGAGALTASVTFPYSLYNWSIDSWYSTNDGLRFFGVYFHGEQILYDYRTPWVWLNGALHALTTPNLIEGPNLMVYYASHSFQVKARYNLGNPNMDVTVSTRFYENGTIEPWVLVVSYGGPFNIAVGQRFDFDLGGSDDDNQQYYDGANWKTAAQEGAVPDAWFGEDANGNQWRDFDTDTSGNSNVIDQAVYVRPYHTDASTWYELRYRPGEVSSTPVMYLTGETINTYVGGLPDPWVGYDAVNWYLSSYNNAQVVYPGPWITAVV
jgi:hypothetical protein